MLRIKNRHNNNNNNNGSSSRRIEEDRQGKIRKRGCSSSSSSSSSSSLVVVHHNNYKRPLFSIPQKKRTSSSGGGSNNNTTPTSTTTWKIMKKKKKIKKITSHSKSPYSTSKPPLAPVSARKLVATLWQMNDHHLLPPPPNSPPHPLSHRNHSGNTTTTSHHRRTTSSSAMPTTTTTTRRRRSLLTHHPNPNHRLGGQGFHSPPSPPPPNFILQEIQPQGLTTPILPTEYKARLKDLTNCIHTSKQLLRILKRVLWAVEGGEEEEDHNSSTISVVSALSAEIERARVQANHLSQERRSDRTDINSYLLNQLAQEKATWKCKEQQRLDMSLKPIKQDLEAEKKLRRRTESLNKTLGRELAETKLALSKATKEVATEKRAREIMEQICDELAQGIGEDKAKVEQLKKESVKVREEVDKEREMLQLADVLREERVQMKLSEAKYHFEEKNAAVDKLKNELESILRTKKSIKEKTCSSRSQNYTGINSSKPNKTCDDKDQDEKEEEKEVESEEDSEDAESEVEDSAESDLHSIELNMDNSSRSYQWNYDNGFVHEYPNRIPFEEETKGRKSASEKTRKSVSLERRVSDGIGWDFSVENFPRLERWL